MEKNCPAPSATVKGPEAGCAKTCNTMAELILWLDICPDMKMRDSINRRHFNFVFYLKKKIFFEGETQST